MGTVPRNASTERDIALLRANVISADRIFNFNTLCRESNGFDTHPTARDFKSYAGEFFRNLSSSRSP